MPRFLAILTIVLPCLLAALALRAAAAPAIAEHERRAVAHADSLLRSGPPERAYAWLARERTRAGRAGDPGLEIRLLVAEGGARTQRGDARRAEPLLRRALALAESRDDRVRGAAAAPWMGYTLTSLGRFDAAEAVYARWLEPARALGDSAAEAWMRLGLAYCALNLGRPADARDGYERAAAMFGALGNGWGERDALIGLGRAYDDLGALEHATTTYRRVAREAAAAGDGSHEAHALNNLGALEYVRGDPAAAAAAFRRALELQRVSGRPDETVVPAANVAMALGDLGRWDEAAAMLDSLLASVRAAGLGDAEAIVLGHLAELRRREGRMAATAAHARAVLAVGSGTSVESRLTALAHLIRALIAQDSVAAALEVADAVGPALRRRAPFESGVRYDVERANLLLVAGRAREAERLALAAAAGASRFDDPARRAVALRHAGEAAFARGDVATARARLGEAAALWESRRARIRDPHWREQYAGGREISMALATTVLADPAAGDADARARLAFETLQRFKARTLLERVAGPEAAAGRDSVPVPTLAHLQREVLRDGEVLLDAFVGADTTLLFAVTRARCAVAGLPGDAALAARLGPHRDLVARVPEGSDERRARVRDRAAREIGAWLLAGVAAEVASARTVVFSPDGALHLAVLEMLTLPGETEWLGGRRRVSETPAAALLALARARAAEGGRTVARAIAVAASEGPDGTRLTGALTEARWLARHYERTDLKLDGVPGSADFVHATLGLYDVLHFAAHAEVDDQHPWRSGVLVRPSARGTRDAFLRAEDLLGLDLPARIAVLSACASAGVPGPAGEGLLGLSSAFVCAGVPAVVATRWPVEDRASAEFMKAFYAALGRGAPAGEALARAKRTLARARATEAPVHWAGFVLIGDPDVRIPLRARPDGTVVLGLTLAVMAVAAVLALLSRRRREPV